MMSIFKITVSGGYSDSGSACIVQSVGLYCTMYCRGNPNMEHNVLQLPCRIRGAIHRNTGSGILVVGSRARTKKVV